MGRFEGRPLSQPLIQQQSGGGTVQLPAAVASEAEAISGGPSTAVLIHPGQGQIQHRCQAQSIPPAVFRLGRRSSTVIQGQPDHETFNTTGDTMAPKNLQISVEASAPDGPQRRDTDTKWIAAGKADATSPHIKTEH